MLLTLLIDAAILIGCLIFGFLLLKLLSPSLELAMRVALSFPVGAACFSWLLFVVSWIGVSLDKKTIVIGFVCSLLLTLAPNIKHRDPSTRHIAKSSLHLSNTADRLAVVSIFIFFLVSALLSVGRSYSSFDAVAIWGSKGYGIALDQSVFGARRSGHGLSYPLNIPIIISIFRILSGDVIPSSKLIFPLFYSSMLLAIYCFWRRYKVNQWVAFAGILILGTVPAIFKHSTYGYANLPLTTYIILAMLMGWISFEDERAGQHVVTGILLGAIGWTRLEGSIYSISIISTLLLSWVLLKPGHFKPKLHLVPFFLITGLWIAFFFIYGSSQGQAKSRFLSGIQSILAGDLGLHSLRLIFGYNRRYLFNTDLWGFLFPVNLALFGLALPRIYSKKPALELTLLIGVITTSIVTISIFYLGSFGSTGFLGWLTRSFPREFFPNAILLTILSVSSTRLILSRVDE